MCIRDSYISADIEGTCGIVDWEETNLHDPQATYHKEQMTKEVNAACLGANDLGCEDIFVKDADVYKRQVIYLLYIFYVHL